MLRSEQTLDMLAAKAVGINLAAAKTRGEDAYAEVVQSLADGLTPEMLADIMKAKADSPSAAK